MPLQEMHPGMPRQALLSSDVPKLSTATKQDLLAHGALRIHLPLRGGGGGDDWSAPQQGGHGGGW